MTDRFRIPLNGHPRRVETFRFTLPPDVAVLSSLRHSLSRWLDEAGVGDPPRADVVLATHEAAANAIEHAGASGSVDVEATVGGGGVLVEIKDHGRWKPSGVQDVERGRGLALMRALVSDVVIDTDTNGTTLRLYERA